MKKFFKKVVLPLNLALMCFVCVYALTVAIKSANNYEIYSKPAVENKIYTVWQVETFEGGSKSRINYLNAVSRQIEKENLGVLVMVKQIKPENLASELESSCPDIISFGFGVGGTVLPKLVEFDNSFSIRTNLVNSAMYNNKLYALPYIVSGYAVITHGSLTKTLHCGQNDYINPAIIYNELNLKPVKKESQYDAYKSFVNNKDATLLGSGRDVYRINNLNNIGRTNAIITPVNTYTDLVQYIAKTKNDDIIEKFINLCVSTDMQLTLSNYNLFSCLNINLYTDGVYKQMETALNNCTVAKVFYD